MNKISIVIRCSILKTLKSVNEVWSSNMLQKGMQYGFLPAKNTFIPISLFVESES